MSFQDFGLDAALLRAVADMGFTEPTPIQKMAVPPALEGRDVLASAMTGSGKTAAFVLPILQHLSTGGRSQGTRALVLTPTRELAVQVHEHFQDLGRHTPITSATVFGGVSQNPQERALRKGVDVVVACPGRLLDLMGQGLTKFDGLELLVLDEADRMLDMGFLPDVRRILKTLPDRRQTFLFSATLPRPIVELSRTLLRDPARLDVERPSEPAHGIIQEVMQVPGKLKSALLVELLKRKEVTMALVFTRTKHRANRLAKQLEKANIPCERIHGNRSQNQRQKALSAFRDGRVQVLVATDVASRGIDIEDLPHVVNFDVPGQPDDYVHRVGRTARAQATGHALTFVSPEERGQLAAIERALGNTIRRRQLTDFDYSAHPSERFEVPVQERLAKVRAERAKGRARAKAKGKTQTAGAKGDRSQSRNRRRRSKAGQSR